MSDEFLQSNLIQWIKERGIDDLSLKDWQSLYEFGAEKLAYRQNMFLKFSENKIIPKYTLVHLVELDAKKKPSIPKRFLLNVILSEDLNIAECNPLTSKEKNAPAQWFINQGYDVFSTEINNNWYQIALAIGFTNIESFIDYPPHQTNNLTTKQLSLQNHFKFIREYHSHAITIKSMNTLNEVKSPAITNLIKQL